MCLSRNREDIVIISEQKIRNLLRKALLKEINFGVHSNYASGFSIKTSKIYSDINEKLLETIAGTIKNSDVERIERLSGNSSIPPELYFAIERVGKKKQPSFDFDKWKQGSYIDEDGGELQNISTINGYDPETNDFDFENLALTILLEEDRKNKSKLRETARELRNHAAAFLMKTDEARETEPSDSDEEMPLINKIKPIKILKIDTNPVDFKVGDKVVQGFAVFTEFEGKSKKYYIGAGLGPSNAVLIDSGGSIQKITGDNKTVAYKPVEEPFATSLIVRFIMSTPYGNNIRSNKAWYQLDANEKYQNPRYKDNSEETSKEASNADVTATDNEEPETTASPESAPTSIEQAAIDRQTTASEREASDQKKYDFQFESDSTGNYPTENVNLVIRELINVGITNRNAIIGCLCTMAKESGFKVRSETGYSRTKVDRIRKVFGNNKIRCDIKIGNKTISKDTNFNKLKDSQIEILKSDNKTFFNALYNGWLGNECNTDDGYNFRGRGFVQLTGKANYRKYGYESNPDEVNTPEGSAITAALFLATSDVWTIDQLNGAKDPKSAVRMSADIVAGRNNASRARISAMARLPIIKRFFDNSFPEDKSKP